MSKKIAFYLLAVIVFLLSSAAAGNFIEGGNEIMRIKSVGGRTLEEAYYHGLGFVYMGYALAVEAMGIFFTSILVWLGKKK